MVTSSSSFHSRKKKTFDGCGSYTMSRGFNFSTSVKIRFFTFLVFRHGMRFISKPISLLSSLHTCTNPPPVKSISCHLSSFLSHAQNPSAISQICSKLRERDGVLTFLEQQRFLPILGSREISQILLRCQTDPLIASRFFDMIKRRPATVTSYNYCVLIHILVWCRNFAQAMKYLLEAIESYNCPVVFENLLTSAEGCNWDPVVFDMLIKACVRSRLARDGFEVFKRMIEIEYIPSVSTCNCLLNGLLKTGFFELCWPLYEEIKRIGIRPNSYTFNIMTHLFCKDEGVNKVGDFLEKMEGDGLIFDVITYNTLIDSYCKKRRLSDAFYLYKIMYRRGILPNLVSYTTLVGGLCMEGKVKEAHQLFHQMIHRGFSPDNVSYSALIHGYSNQGKLQESSSLMYEMIQNGLIPDSETCTKLVEGYRKDGKLRSCLNLVEKLRRYGVPVPLDIDRYLILALCEGSKPHAAKNLFKRTFKGVNETHMDIYNTLIQAFCECNFVKEALELKDEMIHEGMKPNLTTYQALIMSLCTSNKSMEGNLLLREMVDSGLVPNNVICAVLINGMCVEGDIYEAESVLRFFVEKFHIYDAESYNILMKVHCREGNVAKSLELQDRMLKLGFVPNSSICKSLIYGLYKSRDCV